MAGIIEFYKGRNIFITGASGFMGKALMEKLLRSCPDIGNIYILLRAKKGKDINERLRSILTDPIFDTLKRDNPDNLTKIIPLNGDCSELNLGLSTNDRKLLIEEVSIVFHGAANVRFDDPLKSAILLNLRGTREIMLLSRSIKQLKVHVHISTTFANCDRSEVDEIIYPPPADWRKIIPMAETSEDSLFNILTKKIIGVHPNTYTFTKSLAEHVVKDFGENMPVVIFRPSIVVSSMKEPVPGWVDNFNGPVGLLVAGGKGILRTVYGDPDMLFDFMPVDICIKFMILASWNKGISEDTNSEPTVYNSSAQNLKKITLGQLINLGFHCVRKVPLNDAIWWPDTTINNNMLIHKLEAVFLHLLPGMIIDGLLKFSGKKPTLVRLQQKIYSANMSLGFFTKRSWIFNNDKLLSLRSKILLCDKKEFNLYGLETADQVKFFTDCIQGSRLYLLNEHPDTLPKARVHCKRLYWIDRFVRTVIIASLIWFVYKYLHNISQGISFTI